jgi:hypothetical protein
MAKVTKRVSKAKKPLDTMSRKRGRGRPGVPADEVVGRADNYRLIFSNMFAEPEAPLLNAKTTEEVVSAFESWPTYLNQFAPIAGLILQVMNESKFPKTRDAQVKFLADSLGARGEIAPSSSRDLCGLQRAKEKSANHIIRCEFYIECSCGYKGHSHDHRCQKCGAGIPFGLNPLLSPIF